jgi:hypothetical protein
VRLRLGLCERSAGAVDALEGFACLDEAIGFEDIGELAEFESVDLAQIERGELGGEEVLEEFACECRFVVRVFHDRNYRTSATRHKGGDRRTGSLRTRRGFGTVGLKGDQIWNQGS